MDLPQTAAQLYALAPEDFTAARDAAAKQARAEGDRELARDVAALRRPTASAWLVNLLVRDDGELLEQLLALGPALAEAQRDGEGEPLRALSRQRRQLVGAVADRAAALAGRRVTPAHRAEVEATLEAALADPGSADAVRSGRLVRPLAFAGFGGVDLAGAVAVPAAAASPKAAGAEQPRERADRDQADREQADRDRAAQELAAREKAAREKAARELAEAVALAASGALDDAARACERAERARADAARAVDDARTEVEEHRAALVAAEERAAAAEQRSASAAQEAEDAVRSVAAAQDAAERARAALDRLRRG